MKLSIPHRCALAAVFFLAGCHGSKPAVDAPKPAARATVDYPLVGVVRELDTAKGRVTIHHEAIPGFMDAMTMPFQVKDHGLLEDVRVGDEVEGTLHVIKDKDEVSDYELTRLVVSKPAEPSPISLNVSRGKLEVGAVVKPLVPGEVVPDFTMTTQEGRSLKLSELRGKVVALTFIYTRCPLPDFCPRMDRKFAALGDLATAVPSRAEHIRLLSVSFDPEHDTPAILEKHARLQGARPPLWTFAVAQHLELNKVARQLGLTYGPMRGEIVHNLTVAVIGPDGRLVRLESGSPARAWEPAELLHTIVSVLPKASH
jgi:protein SCO1/2